MKNYPAFGIILFAVLISSCTGKSSQESAVQENLVSEKDTLHASPILYQIALPVDMIQIFEKAGIRYNKDIPNPVSKADEYTQSGLAAINLGIYGIDLGYIKLFGDPQAALKYFNAIHKLATQLGIPEEYLAVSRERFEQNISNKDSLSRFINDVYKSSDEYLKKAGRPEAASLIVMGGWIESLYITCQAWLKQNQTDLLTRRISSQKYTLNSLISLLSNYAGEPDVSQYLLMLKILKKSFDKVNILYPQGKVDLDTINKVILSEEYKIDVDENTIREIATLITNMRQELVD